MKVRLIKEKTIRRFMEENAPARQSFQTWLDKIFKVDWITPACIVESFIDADILGNGTDRVVFDIGGNNYRMICKYLFGRNSVLLFICWIGTHANYSKLCKENKQYKICQY